MVIAKKPKEKATVTRETSTATAGAQGARPGTSAGPSFVSGDAAPNQTVLPED